MTVEIDHRGYNPAWQAIPSVTQVIASAGLMGNTSYFTDWHRDRGSYAHKAVELYEADDLDLDTLDPQLRPYLDAWLLFKRDTNWITAHSELPLLSSQYRYKGKIDLVGMMNGIFTQIDIKTGAAAKHQKYQIAAYQHLLRENNIQVVNSYCVYLKANGKYSMSGERATKADFNVFLTALISLDKGIPTR